MSEERTQQAKSAEEKLPHSHHLLSSLPLFMKTEAEQIGRCSSRSGDQMMLLFKLTITMTLASLYPINLEI